MSKKSKWIIASVVIVVVAIFFITTVFQRQYRNVLMEMIMYPEGVGRVGSPVYRFIIQNNGTLISYTGISLHTNVERPSTIMFPFVRRRARVTLSDEDFYYIVNLVFIVSETYATAQGGVFSLRQVVLLYDGKIYQRQRVEVWDLSSEIIRLSPLMTQYHDPRISPN